MATVETVRGAIDTADLGPTYMHEHVFVLDPDVQQNYPAEWGREDDRVADAVGKLKALAAQGIPASPTPPWSAWAATCRGSSASPSRCPNCTSSPPPAVTPTTRCRFSSITGVRRSAPGVPDPMVDMFVSDITEGIAGTEVKAAFLKCAIDHQGMTDGVARVMRAVAQAHRTTGAPITVHTHPGSESGLAVKALLCDEEGVDPTRVVLGHSGDSTDIDHLSALADEGFILGMDRFGINVATTFEARADTLVEMCRRGYADRMVLAHDAACYIDWIDPNVLAMMTDWNYLHIHDDVLPYIRERA